MNFQEITTSLSHCLTHKYQGNCQTIFVLFWIINMFHTKFLSVLEKKTDIMISWSILTLIKFILSFHKRATLVHGFFLSSNIYYSFNNYSPTSLENFISRPTNSQFLSQLVLMGSHHLRRTFLVLALEVPRHRITSQSQANWYSESP